jgi:hypothetical protein
LLRAKHDDLKHILDRLERAVNKLKECSHLLSSYEDAHAWSRGDESLEATINDEHPFGSLPRSH